MAVAQFAAKNQFGMAKKRTCKRTRRMVTICAMKTYPSAQSLGCFNTAQITAGND